MPDNDYYNKKNNNKDRTVPPEENYYGSVPVDLNFNRRENTVIDNQISADKQFNEPGFNPAEKYYSADSYNSAAPAPANRRQNPAKSVSKMPAGNKSRKKGSNNKAKKSFAAIIAALLAIVIIATGLIYPVLGKINYDDKIENTYVNQSELYSASGVTNILLLGVDARSDEDEETSRSDSMMLISLDSKHHCIKLISFLRDTWIYIPSKDKSQRLNAACSYGGYQGVVDTIEYNFGIDIDGYVVTDFEMFKVMVDSIGGVEIDVTEAEAKEVTNHQKRYDHVTLEAGKHTLSGEQALAYCRIRKIDTDWKRTERQRTVMQEILKGILHSGPVTDYKMAKNVAPYIETNLSKSEIIKAGMRAAFCVSGGFVQTSCPFDGTWEYTKKSGASVIGIDVEKNKSMLIDYIYGKSKSEIENENDKDD